MDKSNAKKLMEEINKKKSKNHKSFTINRVKEVLPSDILSLETYANAIIRYGNYDIYMSPHGVVKDVLFSYGLAKEKSKEEWC